MKTRNIALILASISIYLVGCHTLEWEWQATLEKGIGIMKYDESLATWGEPISIFQGDTIFVVTWGSEKAGPIITSAIPVGKSAMIVTDQSRSGWKISATFSNKSRILTSIKCAEW